MDRPVAAGTEPEFTHGSVSSRAYVPPSDSYRNALDAMVQLSASQMQIQVGKDMQPGLQMHSRCSPVSHNLPSSPLPCSLFTDHFFIKKDSQRHCLVGAL